MSGGAEVDSIKVTPYQLGLLHHTLGVNPERREPYRNHFVASPGHHDIDHLEVLVAMGYMARGYRPAFLEDDDVVFQCTDAGRAYALVHLPQPPKRSKYEDYRRSESSSSFAEWMGIDVPRVDVDHRSGHQTLYRYRRDSLFSWENVTGEWKSTKKEAKASYKEALRKRRAAERVKP